jgi:hypothetical protein
MRNAAIHSVKRSAKLYYAGLTVSTYTLLLLHHVTQRAPLHRHLDADSEGSDMDTPSEAEENDSDADDDDSDDNNSENDVIDDLASSVGGLSVRGSKPLTAAAEFAATLAEYDSDGWGELDEEVRSSIDYIVLVLRRTASLACSSYQECITLQAIGTVHRTVQLSTLHSATYSTEMALEQRTYELSDASFATTSD